MDIDVLIDLWRQDIDSVPFAHENQWTTYPVGDLRTEATHG